MNKYTKPTFMIASLGVSALAAASCQTKVTDDDKDFFDNFLPGWETNGFHSTENCRMPLDEYFESYCKFTSAEISGIGQAFIS